MSVLPTMLLLVLKLAITLPPLSMLLSRVRNGEGTCACEKQRQGARPEGGL